MRARVGKIARLPEKIRQELNHRLLNGARGRDMPAWLNEPPEVQQVLAQFFGGRPVTEHNISEWRAGGYQDWLRQEETKDRLRQMAKEYQDLGAARGQEFLDAGMRGMMAVEFSEAINQLYEMEPDARWRRLQKISQEICRLQKTHCRNREIQLQQVKASQGESDLLGPSRTSDPIGGGG